jgi:hypothetical protein
MVEGVEFAPVDLARDAQGPSLVGIAATTAGSGAQLCVRPPPRQLRRSTIAEVYRAALSTHQSRRAPHSAASAAKGCPHVVVLLCSRPSLGRHFSGAFLKTMDKEILRENEIINKNIHKER